MKCLLARALESPNPSDAIPCIASAEFGPEYDSNIDIAIYIMPGSDSNLIHLSLEGSVPIAILGSDRFDVTHVDMTTVAFGPGGAPFTHDHGLHYDDMNNDAFSDLIAHFHVDETGIDPTPLPSPEPEPKHSRKAKRRRQSDAMAAKRADFGGCRIL